MRRFAIFVGSAFLKLVENIGRIAFLFVDIVRCLFRYRLRYRVLLEQLYFIGIKSQTVVIITGAFTGAVFAAQIQFQFGPLGMNSSVGPAVAISMCRELGPVLCALMLAGRVGAALATELGSMKITEQIDALRALAVYPTEYLVVPRFLAFLLATPILTGLTMVCGIAAGYYVAVPLLGVDGVYYWANTEKFTHAKDVWIGLIKGLLFGIIIVLVSCHKGLTAGQGAQGVGKATTEAVVHSSITILICNFFFSFFLNAIFQQKV